MELIDRYVSAVRFWLPANSQDDIAAELEEDLRSQVAGKEGELGRPLSEAEVVALLKERGEPTRVASHYHPQPVLIGAELLPVYWFVLRLITLWILVPVFALIIGPMEVAKAADKGSALLNTGWNLAMAAVFSMGVITLVFAIIERSPRPVQDWDPRKLPRIPRFKPSEAQKPVPRWESIAQISTAVLTSAIWLGVMWRTEGFDLNGARLTLAPIWRTLEWPILLVPLSGIATGWMSLVQPVRSMLQVRLRLAVHLCCLLLMGVLLGSGPWAELTWTGATAQSAAKTNTWMNFGIEIGLYVTLLITALDAFQELRRIWRKRSWRVITA